MLNLGVNIDHVATLRQARRAKVPSPLAAAAECEAAGCWGITAHLREDRRHINDEDIFGLIRQVRRLNMEMAITDEMIGIATRIRPNSCCLVPEKRQELTTEGGLDAAGQFDRVAGAVKALQASGIKVSLFIDAEPEQIRAAAEAKSDYIEMHTGRYANAAPGAERERELAALVAGAELAFSLGLKVNAGHGIDYENIGDLLKVPHLCELNIGHSIISRAVFCGLRTAVAVMLEKMRPYAG